MEKSRGNTAKRLNGSSSPRSPQSPKKRSSRKLIVYVPSIFFASLIGTYSDLYFVGKDFYEFPVRPFPEIFTINILFTLLILPFSTWLYLYIVETMTMRGRLLTTLALSGLVPFIERVAVQLGILSVGEQWNHMYSFVGYFWFLMVIWRIFTWTKMG